MVENIFPDLYRIEIPLPRSPLRTLNAYVLKGRDRTLVVDTGWNQEVCLRAMLAGLQELKVDLDRTDFFITHLHADHIGLVGRLMGRTSRVYMGELEASVATAVHVNRKERVDLLFRIFLSYGYPEAELREAVEKHPGFRYGPPIGFPLHPLREGEPLEVGEFSFRCIHTPGHSPGHLCLYEPEKKILVSGDHILSDITPNITFWPEMENSLGEYLGSLEKVYPLDVRLVLPGHRSLIGDHQAVIRSLREHHRKRLDEVRRALEQGERTAWDVAPHLTWDLDIRSWGQFPAVQKWFATGETVAHLRHLEALGEVFSEDTRGKRVFSLR